MSILSMPGTTVVLYYCGYESSEHSSSLSTTRGIFWCSVFFFSFFSNKLACFWFPRILFLILVTDLPPSIALGMEPGERTQIETCWLQQWQIGWWKQLLRHDFFWVMDKMLPNLLDASLFWLYETGFSRYIVVARNILDQPPRPKEEPIVARSSLLDGESDSCENEVNRKWRQEISWILQDLLNQSGVIGWPKHFFVWRSPVTMQGTNSNTGNISFSVRQEDC